MDHSTIQSGKRYESASTGFRAHVDAIDIRNGVTFVQYHLLHNGVDCEVTLRDFTAHYRTVQP